jgi:hypothetical protein
MAVDEKDEFKIVLRIFYIKKGRALQEHHMLAQPRVTIRLLSPQ